MKKNINKHVCVICAVILLVSGVFLVKNFFWTEKLEAKTETVVIDSVDTGENAKIIDSHGEFALDKINKIELGDGAENLYGIHWFDNDNLLDYSIVDNGEIHKAEMYKIDISSNEKESIGVVEPIYHNFRCIKISPDKSKIIVRVDDEEWKRSSLIYNLKTKQFEDIPENPRYLFWSEDSSKLLGTKVFYDITTKYGHLTEYVIYDSNTNESKYISCDETSEDDNEVMKKYILKNELEMKPSSSLNKLFFAVGENRLKSSIYCIETEGEQKASLILDAEYVFDYEIVDDEKIYFCGKYKGQLGLFSVNIKTNEIKTLLEDNIYSFLLSPDKKMISYVVSNKKNGKDLYAAEIDEDKLENSTLIFKGVYKAYMMWNEDNKKLLADIYNENYFQSETYMFYFK